MENQEYGIENPECVGESEWDQAYREGMKATSYIALPLVFLFSAGAFVGSCFTGERASLEKAAHRAKMAIYEPVGNGGALAESNGHISERRREMYRAMSKIERAVLNENLSEEKVRNCTPGIYEFKKPLVFGLTYPESKVVDCIHSF